MKVAGCGRVVTWGGLSDKHSHRWIWSAYDRAARKLGLDAVKMAGNPGDRDQIRAGDLVFALDIWSGNLAPAVPGARYVLHNFPSTHPLFETLKPEQFIRLQVHSKAAHGERLGLCRHWVAENRTLQQPWGTDLFAEEFWEPVFNASSRDAVFVGAIWNTDGQGNAAEIVTLKEALRVNGLRFLHKTQITDDEMLILIRSARLAPAIAGAWQVENDYLPCRVFKNVSYGALAVTNVPRFYDLFEDCSLQSTTIPELVDEALSLKGWEYAEMVLAQQRVVSKFTYRESLQAIDAVFGG